MSAATEFIERWRNITGVLVQMSQMIAKRELLGPLEYKDGSCIIQQSKDVLIFYQAVHGISPFVCGAEAPPRLCDPPCPEEQAGIGPISQKPELSTISKYKTVS
jgi:hypothetical protein